VHSNDEDTGGAVEEVIYSGLRTSWKDGLFEEEVRAGVAHAQPARSSIYRWRQGRGTSSRWLPVQWDDLIPDTWRTTGADGFLTAIMLFTLSESFGGVESLAERSAQIMPRSIPPYDRALIGTGDDLIQPSVGVEEEEDLVHDVMHALLPVTAW